MATDNLLLSDQYVTDPQRRAILRAMEQQNVSIPALATEMRISNSHLYGMLRGDKKMAYHYSLSIKMVLLNNKLGR